MHPEYQQMIATALPTAPTGRSGHGAAHPHGATRGRTPAGRGCRLARRIAVEARRGEWKPVRRLLLIMMGAAVACTGMNLFGDVRDAPLSPVAS